LQIGRINPATLKQKVGAGAKRVPMTGLLVELASAPDPGARLDQIEPPYPGYRALLAQLPRYLELAGKPFTVFPAPRKVAPGRAYPGAGVLAERLTALGDLTAEEAKTLRPGWYDPALAEAVKSFQGRHGLQPDGLLGGKTLVQLNTPYTQRLEQIQLTLERWRWISLDPGKRLIWVNLPAFNLAALTPKEASYTWDLTCKVVVGEAFEHKTHVLTGEINTVVFRPFWNVPPSVRFVGSDYDPHQPCGNYDVKKHCFSSVVITQSVMILNPRLGVGQMWQSTRVRRVLAGSSSSIALNSRFHCPRSFSLPTQPHQPISPRSCHLPSLT
jgi:murein L,D-transpeptidase YcbB/YkuD